MTRRTGKEALYCRRVDKDIRKLSESLENREARLAALGFDEVTEDQRAYNRLCLELYK